MTIVLDTLATDAHTAAIEALLAEADQQIKVVGTRDMKIAHCMGCNQCWLKTPGRCAIKDDYETIVRLLADAHNLWLATDTRFGFIDWRGKLVMDRIMPLLNMYIEFRKGWMRHQLRYGALNVGVLYRGCGDTGLLQDWSERCAMNLGGHSLGVFALDGAGKEMAPCT